VNSSEVDAKRVGFIAALRSAYAARRGVSPDVEPAVRAYARAMREAGIPVGRALVDVKDLVRAHTGYDEPIFTPKVIGWAVAGYFAGTSRRDSTDP
jgi:enhancing lycopene biosynthesis protein 2